MNIQEIIDISAYCASCLGFSTGLFFFMKVFDYISAKD